MTNTKNTRNAISRPAFLRAILEDPRIEMSDDMRKTGTEWLAALTKSHAPKEPTREQLANIELLNNVLQAIAEMNGTPVTARWVVNNVPGVFTIQKASALLRKAVKDGRVIADVTKKVTEYTLA